MQALSLFWSLVRTAAVRGQRNNMFGIAKGAAFSALLSFFPVFTTITAILVQANALAVSRNLSRLVFRVVPPGTEQIVMEIFTVRGKRPVALLAGAAVLSVLAASGVMLSLMEGFRAAYGIPKGRSWIRSRVVAAGLVFSAALPVVLASAMIVFGRNMENWMLYTIGLLPEGEKLRGPVSFFGYILRAVLATAAIVTAASLLYAVGPNPPRRFRSVLPGALLATALWWLATALFAWYVRNIADYNVLYGSVGAVIALLVWMYLLSIIALYGCEFNAARDRALKAQREAR